MIAPRTQSERPVVVVDVVVSVADGLTGHGHDHVYGHDHPSLAG
jgi:hypothetical protein